MSYNDELTLQVRHRQRDKDILGGCRVSTIGTIETTLNNRMKERENDEKQINQILLSLASLERVSNASSSFVPVPACEIGTWRTCPALPRSSVDCYLFKTTQKTLGKRGGERRIVRFIILSYRTQPVVYCVQQIIIIIIIIPA